MIDMQDATPQKKPISTPQQNKKKLSLSGTPGARSPLCPLHNQISGGDAWGQTEEDGPGTPLGSLIKQKARTRTLPGSTAARGGSTDASSGQRKSKAEAACWGQADTESDKRAMFLTFLASFGGGKATRPASAAVTKAEYSTVTTSTSAPSLGDATTAQRRRPASAAPGVSAALNRWSKFTPSDEEMTTDSSSEFLGGGGGTALGINRDGSMMPQRAATAGRRRRRRGVRSAGPSRLSVLSTPSAHHQVAVLETKYAKKAQAPRMHNGRMLRPDSAPAGWGVPSKALPGLAGASSSSGSSEKMRTVTKRSEQFLPAGVR